MWYHYDFNISRVLRTYVKSTMASPQALQALDLKQALGWNFGIFWAKDVFFWTLKRRLKVKFLLLTSRSVTVKQIQLRQLLWHLHLKASVWMDIFSEGHVSMSSMSASCGDRTLERNPSSYEARPDTFSIESIESLRNVSSIHPQKNKKKQWNTLPTVTLLSTDPPRCHLTLWQGWTQLKDVSATDGFLHLHLHWPGNQLPLKLPVFLWQTDLTNGSDKSEIGPDPLLA